MRRLLVTLAIVAVAACTLVVFLAYDASSHSASDTLRPFVLTMTPVWALAVAAFARFRRRA